MRAVRVRVLPVINIINGCAKGQNVERETIARKKAATIDPLFSACHRARVWTFFFFSFPNRARDGLVGWTQLNGVWS